MNNKIKKMRAAVIGLGNIGFQFDLDPLRKGTWSHVSAYSKCRSTKLVGAVEVDHAKIKLFKDNFKGSVPVFQTVDEMMKKESPDIVSICTPTSTHYSTLKTLLKYPVKAIFCEKPIAGSIEEAREMVKLCTKKRVVLAVNHTRRWDANYLYVRDSVKNGDIGSITAVQALYSGQVFNIGTHLFDSVRMIVGKNAEKVSGLSHDHSKYDPDVNGWILFGDNVRCAVLATGKREDLIFEIDVIGDKGRIKISENGEKIEKFLFVKSKRYTGYKELRQVPVKSRRNNDKFIEALNDIVSVVNGKKDTVNCSGFDGLAALSLSVAIRSSANYKGRPQKVRC